MRQFLPLATSDSHESNEAPHWIKLPGPRGIRQLQRLGWRKHELNLVSPPRNHASHIRIVHSSVAESAA
jgi:hypothetical protein